MCIRDSHIYAIIFSPQQQNNRRLKPSRDYYVGADTIYEIFPICDIHQIMSEKQTQLDKFKQAAKELECDESERGFNEKLKRIVKPQDATKKPTL